MRNIKNFPVMAKQCQTCPFNPDGDIQLRSRIEQMVLTKASQTCHHSGGLGKKDTHLCRGARDFQLQIFYRMGYLEDPTDEAWDRKMKEVVRA